MKATLLVVGKTADPRFGVLIDEYIQRTRFYLSFDMEVIPELKNTKNLSQEQQKEKEGELILRALAPGDHVVIARRKGKVWYIAGINGKDTAATLKFSLQRLSLGGSGTACLITDEANGRHFHIEPSTPVSPDNVLHTDCLPRGGFVLILTEGTDN